MNRFASQRRRLAWVLGGVFAALLAASAVLVVQSFDRLRLESFVAQRTLAEDLVGQISRRLQDVVAAEEARPPTDYDFLIVEGERYVQRSPLSSLHPETNLPGVVGYFQIDAGGRFSTPLLPAEISDLDALELTEAEFRQRQALQGRLRDLLEAASAGSVSLAAAVDEEAPGTAFDSQPKPAERQAASAVLGDRSSAPARSEATAEVAESVRGAQENDGRTIYNQLLGNASGSIAKDSATARYKVSDLELEESLASRLPQAEPPATPAPVQERRRDVRQVQVDAGPQAPPSRRITAFESAVDPLALAILDAQHFVLFRKVWLDGQQIQGAIVDQAALLDAVVGEAFAATALARSSDLLVAFQGDVVRAYPSVVGSYPPDGTFAPAGNLLLRTRLAPAGGPLELVFSVADLPLGPGATTLAWSALLMTVVLCVGFALLLRLGRHHIRLAEQQQDFVSAVSHELKTPLTSIRMYGEILKAGWADEARKRTYYDFILSESERLSRLIGNVLQLARINRNAAPAVDPRPVAVANLIDQLRSKIDSAVAAGDLSLEIQVDTATDEAVVAVDEDAFMQVMINLVDNAIKFSVHAERRVIELGCRMQAEQVEFSVRDFGPGVPREQMKKIFRLFYRTESELTRETVGTGIGLALVRELTDQMGGSVDVVNREPGAEFRVRLPQCAPEPAAPA